MDKAKALEDVVLKHIREILHVANSLFAHEVTNVDCQSWIGVHRYICIDWRTHVLLTLERVVEGGTSNT